MPLLFTSDAFVIFIDGNSVCEKTGTNSAHSDAYHQGVQMQNFAQHLQSKYLSDVISRVASCRVMKIGLTLGLLKE